MYWSCRKMGYEKLTDNRYPESGSEIEARKTEIAMGDCIKSVQEKVEEE